jgi:Ulp1 family protease
LFFFLEKKLLDVQPKNKKSKKDPADAKDSTELAEKYRKVFRVNNIDIYQGPLDDLTNGGWLQDDIMEAYISCQIKDEIPSVYYMSGLHSQQIFLRKKMPFLELKDLSAFDMILVPLLVNGNHWTVVLISNLTETITYINPMGTTQFALNNILKRWNDYCSLHPILKQKKWSADLVNHEIQKDIVSCGIFITIFMEKFISYDYNYYFDSSSKNLANIRAYIYDTLRKNSTV